MAKYRVGSGRLPPADQLSWLVSRDQADQDLLPLPSSLPVDPELASDLQVKHKYNFQNSKIQFTMLAAGRH